jgi:hypothetical protein
LCVVASSGYYEEFFTRLDIVLMVEIIPHWNLSVDPQTYFIIFIKIETSAYRTNLTILE